MSWAASGGDERRAFNGQSEFIKKIYTVNESGTFAVLRAGDTLDVAGVNKLGESVRAAPAIVGDALYLRSAGHLWAFGESTTRKP